MCSLFVFLQPQTKTGRRKTKKGGGARKEVEQCWLGRVDIDMGISIIREAMSRARTPAYARCVYAYMLFDPRSGRLGLCVCVVRVGLCKGGRVTGKKRGITQFL
jgi:hypothetical protein